MKNWQKALEKFIEPWKTEKDVEGILLVGSHSIKGESEDSDIDVQIILSGKCHWKERGSDIVDGFIVDYSATPYSMLEDFMDQTMGQVKITSRKIALGVILFDKKGLAKKLRDEAKKKLNEKFKKHGRGWIETRKYLLWFGLKDLTSLYEKNSPGFRYESQHYISDIIEAYAKFKQVDIVQSSKTYKCLTDKAFAKKYKTNAFPDPAFNESLLSCLTAPAGQQEMTQITKLAKYVINEMGGFEVEGWKLRTSLK